MGFEPFHCSLNVASFSHAEKKGKNKKKPTEWPRQYPRLFILVHYTLRDLTRRRSSKKILPRCFCCWNLNNFNHWQSRIDISECQFAAFQKRELNWTFLKSLPKVLFLCQCEQLRNFSLFGPIKVLDSKWWSSCAVWNENALSETKELESRGRGGKHSHNCTSNYYQTARIQTLTRFSPIKSQDFSFTFIVAKFFGYLYSNIHNRSRINYFAISFKIV